MLIPMMLTNIPGACQGDTWTPGGNGCYPQIIREEADESVGIYGGYIALIDEADENDMPFATPEDAARWLSDQMSETFVLKEAGVI